MVSFILLWGRPSIVHVLCLYPNRRFPLNNGTGFLVNSCLFFGNGQLPKTTRNQWKLCEFFFLHFVCHPWVNWLKILCVTAIIPIASCAAANLRFTRHPGCLSPPLGQKSNFPLLVGVPTVGASVWMTSTNAASLSSSLTRGCSSLNPGEAGSSPGTERH